MEKRKKEKKPDLLPVSEAREQNISFFLPSLCIRNFTHTSFPFSEKFYQGKLQVPVTGGNRFLIEQVGTLQQSIPAASREKKKNKSFCEVDKMPDRN